MVVACGIATGFKVLKFLRPVDVIQSESPAWEIVVPFMRHR